MTAQQEKKNIVEKRNALYKDLTQLILKKTNLTKNAVLDVALQNLVAKNIDLLTQQERKKYKDILL